MNVLGWINRFVMIVLALMIVVDASMVAALKIIQIRLNALEATSQGVDQMYRAPGGRRPSAVPEGYTTSNDKVSSGQQVLSGWAVRYASPKCEFCRNDKQWSSLSAELQRLGLQIFAISPSANDAYPLAALVPRESRQEAYVSIEWIKQFRLRTTPTLLIFGADGRLIWCHRKTLSFDDKEAAIRAVSMAIKQRK